MAKITFRLPEELENAVHQKLVQSKYANRSELIRDLLRRWVNGVPLEVTEHV